MRYIYYDYRLASQYSEQFLPTDFKTYYKVTGNKTVWDLSEDEQICNKTEYRVQSYSNIYFQ